MRMTRCREIRSCLSERLVFLLGQANDRRSQLPLPSGRDPMTVAYRYRQERHFAKPPAAIWPFVSDTARLWECNGMIAKMIELIPDQKGLFRNIFPQASQEWFQQYEK